MKIIRHKTYSDELNSLAEKYSSEMECLVDIHFAENRIVFKKPKYDFERIKELKKIFYCVSLYDDAILEKTYNKIKNN